MSLLKTSLTCLNLTYDMFTVVYILQNCIHQAVARLSTSKSAQSNTSWIEIEIEILLIWYEYTYIIYRIICKYSTDVHL